MSMLDLWPLFWFIFDVVRFPPLFFSTVLFLIHSELYGLGIETSKLHQRHLQQLFVLVTLQYGIYGYNGVGGIVKIYVKGAITFLPLIGLLFLGFSNQMTINRQQAKLQKMLQNFELDVSSPQGKFRKALNSFMMKKKQTCEICFEKKHKIEFCAPCNNKDHKICVECFALYVDDGMKSPNGSMFCCPFGEESCSFLSGSKVKKIFNNFRMDYFQKTLFQDLSADVIESRVDQAIIKNVTLALLDTGEAIRCPFKECTNCVVYSEEDMEKAENFNQTVKKSRSPSKNNGLLQMLTSRIGFTKTQKDVARIANSVLSAEFIGAADETFDLRAFKCNSCSKASCVVCFKPWTIGEYNHSGLSCTKYVKLATKLEEKWNEEKEVTRKAVKLKIMRGLIQPCPHCNELIEKNGGCNNMICQKCMKAFVWGAVPIQNFNEGVLDL